MILLGIRNFLRFYFYRVKCQLMQVMEYRVNLFSSVLASYGYNLVVLLFLNVLFGRIETLAGWNHNQMIVLLGTGQIIFYIYASFFQACWDYINEVIVMGRLDMHLLKPVAVLAAVVTNKFTLIEMIPSIFLAVGMVIYGTSRLGIGGGGMGWYLLGIGLGVMIILWLNLVIGILSFWLNDTKDISRLYGNLQDLQNYPAEMYDNKIRWIFFSIIPTSAMAYVPAVFLISGFRWELLAGQIGVGLFFGGLVGLLWKKGLRDYSGASG